MVNQSLRKSGQKLEHPGRSVITKKCLLCTRIGISGLKIVIWDSNLLIVTMVKKCSLTVYATKDESDQTALRRAV